MPCYHPLEAYQTSAGAPLSFSNPRFGARHVRVACGKCIGCRLEYARQWAVRCMHEAQMHKQNCMLTFTYDEENLPADLSLNHRHFQLFMKRLRKHYDVKYYMCGEYGELNSRPHYHAIIFGYYPSDCVFWSKSKADCNVYRSASLDNYWKLGACYVGAVTFESCSYVARYVLKKVGFGKPGRDIFDPETGEIFYRAHEYSKCSLRPAIAAEWFEKYMCDCVPHDRVVVRGVEGPMPRYYNVLLERFSPLYLAELKAARVEKADIKFRRLVDMLGPGADLDRFDAHETVKLASISSLVRE